MQAGMYNGLCLAYIGDSIYEVYMRKYALSLGLTQVNSLHKRVTRFTSALAQAKCVHYLINEKILTEEELMIFKRGRNSHVHSVRKNVDLASYLDATGFEAVMGYLFLNGNTDRLEELIAISLDIK